MARSRSAAATVRPTSVGRVLFSAWHPAAPRRTLLLAADLLAELLNVARELGALLRVRVALLAQQAQLALEPHCLAAVRLRLCRRRRRAQPLQTNRPGEQQEPRGRTQAVANVRAATELSTCLACVKASCAFARFSAVARPTEDCLKR